MSSSTVWLKSRLGTVKAEAVRKPFLKSIGLELEVLLAWFEQVVKLPGLIPPQELILLCVIIFYLWFFLQLPEEGNGNANYKREFEAEANTKTWAVW